MTGTGEELAQVQPSPQKGSRTVSIVLVVVIVVLGAGFGFYYVQSTGTISGLNSTISARNAKIASLNQTIAADDARIANLTATVASKNAEIAADETTIANLRAGYANANATIATLNAQVSNLNAEIATDEAQITTLQLQVSQLTAIANLADSTVEAGSQQFSTGGHSSAVTFTATYAGYVTVHVSAASDFANEGADVVNTFATNVNSPVYGSIDIPATGLFYAFASSTDTLVFPVVPGTVAVYLDTADLTAQTATLTITYYY